jgi:hypothetical protein
LIGIAQKDVGYGVASIAVGAAFGNLPAVLHPAIEAEIVGRMRLTVALTILAVSYAPIALAQAEEWVIVPTSTTNDVEWMDPTVAELEAALSEQGARVLSRDRSVALFEREASGPPIQVTEPQIQRLDALTREALRLIVVQEHAQALELLRTAQSLINEAIAELNRTKTQAQNVLDTCLYTVRALYDTGDRTRAAEQARQCVRLVPRGKADPQKHPPEIVALYEEASRPGPGKSGALGVDSKPEGCDVRINGLRLGKTPFTMTDLYPGDYQVQVECNPDRRGRVHRATVETEKTEVFVDAELDRAVRTEPSLWLRYEDGPDEERQLRDAQAIAEALEVSAVVLASRPAADLLELRLVKRTGPRRAVQVRIPMDPTGPTTKAATDAAVALAAGECMDFTGPRPRTIACPGEEPRPLKPPRGQWISGLALVSAGGASLVASYALLIWRRDTGDVVIQQVTASPSISVNQEKWLRLGDGIVATAATGGALTVAAMPLVLPYRSKTPWWAWVSGGLGVGLAVGSVVSGATAESAPAGSRKCEDQLVSVDSARACVDRERSVDRAIVLGVTAAPLLTIPLVYLLRRDVKKREASVTPSVRFGPSGGSLNFSGRF